jgi:hypothetical protein
VQKFGISVFLKTKQTNSDHPDNHQAFFYQRRTQNLSKINLEKKQYHCHGRSGSGSSSASGSGSGSSTG